MKCKAKLKLQFLNPFKCVLGTMDYDIEVEYPPPPQQKIFLDIRALVRPCVMTGLRVQRSDGMELFAMDLPATFIAPNQEVITKIQLTLRPIHVALLSEVPN